MEKNISEEVLQQLKKFIEIPPVIVVKKSYMIDLGTVSVKQPISYN